MMTAIYTSCSASDSMIITGRETWPKQAPWRVNLYGDLEDLRTSADSVQTATFFIKKETMDRIPYSPSSVVNQWAHPFYQKLFVHISLTISTHFRLSNPLYIQPSQPKNLLPPLSSTSIPDCTWKLFLFHNHICWAYIISGMRLADS